MTLGVLQAENVTKTNQASSKSVFRRDSPQINTIGTPHVGGGNLAENVLRLRRTNPVRLRSGRSR